jgi:hypothetical protein
MTPKRRIPGFSSPAATKAERNKIVKGRVLMLQRMNALCSSSAALMQ